MPYKDKEKKKNQMKEYCQRPEVKERIKEYHKKYYQTPKNIEKKRKYNREYAREYSKTSKRKKYYEEYRKNNKIKAKTRSDIYYKNHQEMILANQRENYLRNREKINAKHQGYYIDYYQDCKEIENERRKLFGLPLVGEGFKQEMKLLVLVHRIFIDYEIFTHHRKPLMGWKPNGLELDIYIPKLKLAFEYMGGQHYRFVKFFHRSIENFEAQQYRDRCKKRLCRLRGITLIRIKYNEKLSEQLILSKLNHFPLISTIQLK